MNQKIKISYILFVAIIMLACGNNKEKPLDTVGIGEITVTADESLEPVGQALADAFHMVTPAAKVNMKFTNELDAIYKMLQDSARVCIVTRELTSQEKKVLEKEKLKYRSLKVGLDAVALICKKGNNDTLITLTKLKKLFLGTDKSRTVVVDAANSSNLTCTMQKLGLTDYTKLNITAAGSNKAVIDYVNKNPNAIGLIGVNWISDGEDAASMGFLKSLNVMSVAEIETPSKGDYYLPFEYNLYLKNYPLRRDIILLTKEARSGLGTGFINYCSSQKGQLVIQKMGILPVTQPLRLYKVKE